MPALHTYGRRWNLGSDDFVYPSIFEILVRTTWLVAICVIYALAVVEVTCTNGYQIHVFYLGTIVLLILYFILNLAIMSTSAKGYIMDTTSRRHLEPLLYTKTALLVIEICWLLLGTIWMFGLGSECRRLPVEVAEAVIVIQWLIIITFIISIALMYDPIGRRAVKKRSLKDYHKMWKGRCRVLCCCLQGDENRRDAFEEVADLLTNFFKGRDYVLTDVLAGVVLLSVKQRCERRNMKVVTVSEASTLPIRDRHPITDSISDKRILTDSGLDLGGSDKCSLISVVDRTDDSTQPNKYFSKSSEKDISIKTISKHIDESTKLADEAKQSYGSTQVPEYSAVNWDPKGQNLCSKDTESSASSRKAPPLRKIPSDATWRESWSSTGSDDVFYQQVAPPSGPMPWMTLENAAYYLRLSCAIYGSSNYGGCYNCSDRIPLCRKYRWRQHAPHLESDRLHGDNWWECEVSSILLYSRLERDNVIYASLDNTIFKTPYIVIRDDERRVVVVAVRGTMSAGDALTDLTAQGEDINLSYIPRGNVHKGSLKAARKLLKELDDLVQLDTNIPKGYQLVLTGHSLGAGVAVILTLLLQERYPDIICYAFCPPGGLVSQPISVYTQNFILTMFLGTDVVPRLGVHNMEKLKSDLLAVIKNSRVPKYKILTNGLLACCCGWSDGAITELLEEDTQTKRLTASMYKRIQEEMQEPGGGDIDCDTIPEEREAHGGTQQETGDIDDAGDRMEDSGVSENWDCQSMASTSTMSSYTGSLTTVSQNPNPQGHRAVTRTASGDSRTSQQSDISIDETSSGQHGRKHQKHKGKPVEKRLSDSHMKWRKKLHKTKTGLAATDPLYLPGQILYLYEDDVLSTKTCCGEEEVFMWRWARMEEFDQIILHSKMSYHHNPYTVDKALLQILAQSKYSPGRATHSLGGSAVITKQPSRGSGFTRSFGFPHQDSIMEGNESKADSVSSNGTAKHTTCDSSNTTVDEHGTMITHLADKQQVINISNDLHGNCLENNSCSEKSDMTLDSDAMLSEILVERSNCHGVTAEYSEPYSQSPHSGNKTATFRVEDSVDENSQNADISLFHSESLNVIKVPCVSSSDGDSYHTDDMLCVLSADEVEPASPFLDIRESSSLTYNNPPASQVGNINQPKIPDNCSTMPQAENINQLSIPLMSSTHDQAAAMSDIGNDRLNMDQNLVERDLGNCSSTQLDTDDIILLDKDEEDSSNDNTDLEPPDPPTGSSDDVNPDSGEKVVTDDDAHNDNLAQQFSDPHADVSLLNISAVEDNKLIDPMGDHIQPKSRNSSSESTDSTFESFSDSSPDSYIDSDEIFNEELDQKTGSRIELPVQTAVVEEELVQTAMVEEELVQTTMMEEELVQTTVMAEELVQTAVMEEELVQTTVTEEELVKVNGEAALTTKQNPQPITKVDRSHQPDIVVSCYSLDDGFEEEDTNTASVQKLVQDNYMTLADFVKSTKSHNDGDDDDDDDDDGFTKGITV